MAERYLIRDKNSGEIRNIILWDGVQRLALADTEEAVRDTNRAKMIASRGETEVTLESRVANIETRLKALEGTGGR